MSDGQKPRKRKPKWKQWAGVVLVSCFVSTSGTAFVMSGAIEAANGRAEVSNKAMKDMYWTFCIERAQKYQSDAVAKKRCEDIWTGVMAANAESDVFVSPLKMVAIIDVESSFNSRAVSIETAFGLAQIHVPAHGRYAKGCDIIEPVCNVKTGTLIYMDELRAFGGNETLASYAYNRGGPAVRASLRRGEYPGKGDYARKVTVI